MLSGLAINTVQLRWNDASVASASFHCGSSAKPALVRRSPGGCGDGPVQPAIAARNTAARIRAFLLRQFARSRHQDPIGIGGAQVALEGPDIGDRPGCELRRDSRRDL